MLWMYSIRKIRFSIFFFLFSLSNRNSKFGWFSKKLFVNHNQLIFIDIKVSLSDKLFIGMFIKYSIYADLMLRSLIGLIVCGLTAHGWPVGKRRSLAPTTFRQKLENHAFYVLVHNKMARSI